jgi:mono/diheme cytochrome c family protein
MTSDLSDSEWKFADGGTFEALAKVIQGGLTTAQTGGMPMPAAASREMTDAQVNALAAYTWSLAHAAG